MPVQLSTRKFFTLFDIRSTGSSVLHSPVPHLLNFNTAPSEEEIELIKEYLLVSRERVAKIQDQLYSNPPQDESEHLHICKVLNQTKSFIHTHQSILFRAFPSEILMSIFLSCLPDLESQPWCRRSWKANPSFRLSHVCRKWRNIALATPKLWTILGDVRVSSDTTKGGPRSHLNFIEELLRRSREMELWIFMYLHRDDYASGGHPIIDMLVKTRERWAAFGIYAGVPTVKGIYEHTSGSVSTSNGHHFLFPSLRKLDVSIRFSTVVSPLIIGFGHAPLLTDVTISGLHPDGLLLPYKQLRVYKELSASTSLIAKLPSFLTHAKDLVELEIYDHYALSPLSNSLTTVVFGKLKALTLSPNGLPHHNSRKAVFDTLVVPKLEELKVKGNSEHHFPIITSLFQRSISMGSEFSLRRLHLPDITFKSGELTIILKLTPVLEDLIIHFPPTVDLLGLTLGRTATNSTETPQLVPKLRNLVVHVPLSRDYVDRHEDTISTLARAIVEDSGKQSDLKVSEDGKKLEILPVPHFRLIFNLGRVYPHEYGCSHEAQTTLNSWRYGQSSVPSAQLAKDSEAVFSSWCRGLNDAFQYDWEKPFWKRTLDLGFSARLDQIIGEIEEFEVSTVLATLFASKLHLPLQRISNFQEKYLRADEKYKFRVRANKIVNKWNAAVSTELKNHKINWALRFAGSWPWAQWRSLIYIPRDDELRNSPEALSAIFYGVKDYAFDDLDLWPNRS